MKDIVKKLIDYYKIEELGYDFMGYVKQDRDILTFHHLFVPKRLNGPKDFDNGVILYSTSHAYLHLIETIDYDLFLELTYLMYMEKINGIRLEELLKIRRYLAQFEYEYINTYCKDGNPLIKEKFIKGRKLK